MTDIKLAELAAGDKVRLTLDVVVDECDLDGEVYFECPNGDLFSLFAYSPELVKVERIVPPFKAGDVLRSKAHSYLYVLLEDNGDGTFRYLDAKYAMTYNTGKFDDEAFERIASSVVAK